MHCFFAELLILLPCNNESYLLQIPNSGSLICSFKMNVRTHTHTHTHLYSYVIVLCLLVSLNVILWLIFFDSADVVHVSSKYGKENKRLLGLFLPNELKLYPKSLVKLLINQSSS